MSWTSVHFGDDKERANVVGKLRSRGLDNGHGGEFRCTEGGDIAIKSQYADALQQAIAEARAEKREEATD